MVPQAAEPATAQPASNTTDCFRSFVGQQLRGILRNALPINRPNLQSGNHTLIFEDGRGLTLGFNGSFWVESKRDVDQALELRRVELTKALRDLREVLELAEGNSAPEGSQEPEAVTG